jgi:hypothetical protein
MRGDNGNPEKKNTMAEADHIRSLSTRGTIMVEQRIRNDTQNLGSVIGSFDIRCTLEGMLSIEPWRPRWRVYDSQVEGVLYFELQFNRRGHAALGDAEVKMSFGEGVNDEPVPTVNRYEPHA